MRPIKFRGMTLKGKWLFGLLNFDEEDNTYFIAPTFAEGGRQVLPETVGQFTGLHDKNNKEVYAKDILKCKIQNGKELIGAIHWCKYLAGFSLCIGEGSIATFRRGFFSPIAELPDGRIDGEIVGNEIEHSDLLKPKPCKKCGRSAGVNTDLCGDCGLEQMVSDVGGVCLKKE